jgi:hypothetical protein
MRIVAATKCVVTNESPFVSSLTNLRVVTNQPPCRH